MFLNIPYDTKKLFKITSCNKQKIDVKTISVNNENFNVIIIDGLYENWELLRNIVINSPSAIFNVNESPCTRNGIDYYDSRCILSTRHTTCVSYLRHIISQNYDIDTYSDVQETFYSNWYYMLKNKTSNYAVPHVDCYNTYKNPIRQFTILTFLNKEDECYGGTGFYKNRYLNSIYPVNEYNKDYDDIIKLYPHIKMHQDNLIMPIHYMQEWDMVDFIPMKPNRTIIFPSNVFHGAYLPTNYYKNVPRINIVTWEIEKIN